MRKVRDGAFLARTEVFEGGKKKALAFGCLLVALIVAGLLLSPKPAHAANFEVDSTADTDTRDCTAAASDCTLRGAINAANAAVGADTIEFNIPETDTGRNATTGVFTIKPTTSALPLITEAVTIDGYSQPEASPNTNIVLRQGTNANLLIELDGSSAGAYETGLTVFKPGGSVSNVVIKGLVVNNFGTGILISSGFGVGHKVEGNFIGTDPTGTKASGNKKGIAVEVYSSATIGGTSPAARNVISGNQGYGVTAANTISGIPGTQIQGNYVGTQKDGISPLGNDAGVALRSSNTTVGGQETGAANIIAFNGGEGVSVNNQTGTGNRILSNSIHNNGKDAAIAVKLGINFDGGDEDANYVTKNDDKDPDIGPNNLQNFPTINSATTSRSTGRSIIRGTLNSTPEQTFTIQFFTNSAPNPSGFGEGQRLLGTLDVTTDASGNASFGVKARKLRGFISATATNVSTGDTSEFSNAKQVVRKR